MVDPSSVVTEYRFLEDDPDNGSKYVVGENEIQGVSRL
jgi:hypothetical protein